MAVRKMEKVTVIAPLDYEESIVSSIQGLQRLEIIDLSDNEKTEKTIQKYFKDSLKTASLLTHESDLLRVTESLDFLGSHRKAPGMFGKLVEERGQVTLEELEAFATERNYLQSVETAERLRMEENNLIGLRKELNEQEVELMHWQSFDANIADVAKLKTATCILGMVSTTINASFREQLDSVETVMATPVYETQNRVYYSIFYLIKDQSTIERIFNKYAFEKIEFEFKGTPAEEYKNVKERLEDLVKDERKLKEELAASKELVIALQRAEEALLALIDQEKTKESLLASKRLFIIRGWLPENEKESFSQSLEEVMPANSYLVDFKEPTPAEYEEVPIELQNKGIVKPFETLTETYSLPKYNELDPTPLMTPFYLVFFGMMVADLGYGFVLLLGTLFIKWKLHPSKKLRKNIDLFFYLSFPTMVWGLIYGSVFGVTLPYTPLLSADRNVNTILILSIAFGFLQICTGLLVNGIQKIKQKDYLGSIDEAFAWEGILVGIVIAIVGMMLIANDLVFYVGVGLSVLGALAIIAVPIIRSRNKVKGAAKGAYNLYGITSYIGDLVSYTRLMALGISGGSIAAAFNMLITFMPGPIKWTLGIVLIVLLQGLNIFLSYLGAYVHGMRLQYVEFFGKFYEGGGRKFAPLKIKEKYFDLKSKKQ